MTTDHKIHEGHSHVHGPNCGHTVLKHNGHEDYVHDGHLHHPHTGHVDEHQIDVGGKNPESCTPDHNCGGHEKGHNTAKVADMKRFRTATIPTTW